VPTGEGKEVAFRALEAYRDGMPGVEVNYLFEYVSGAVVSTRDTPMVAYVHASNVGQNEEHVRALCYRIGGELAFDSLDAVVLPGRGWEYNGEPLPVAYLHDVYRIHIFATSRNLVPSAFWRDGIFGTTTVPEPSSGDGPPPLNYYDDQNVVVVYFAPGDFAVFDLPWRPTIPIVPIGPIEER
jgi:hypothetical protein